MKRQIVLDTETTGLIPEEGHRIIEIGCIELINRRISGNNFHQYINPERHVEHGAVLVHGLKNDFLETKPVFAEIAEEFFSYIDGAELIIHNAPFDIGFLKHEFNKLTKKINFSFDNIAVIDTLELARKMHAGQRNNLDALCKRYKVDNSKRDLHGALLDASLLAEVYLCMTGGQGSLFDSDEFEEANKLQKQKQQKIKSRKETNIIYANEEELLQHQKYLEKIKKKSGVCVWEE